LIPGPAVFDTNIVIDWLRGRPQAIAELDRHAHRLISRITWMEVRAGEPQATRNHVTALMQPFEIIEVDTDIASAAVDIRHNSRIKLLDAIILATARTEGLVLVTRNIKDFPEGTPGVRIPYSLD
jgi:predicted nucleic acid-binding protein